MIRRALTIALCSVTFFLLAFVISAGAMDKRPSVKYVCMTLPAAMETVAYQVDDDMDTMRRRAMSDGSFACYFLDHPSPFLLHKLVYEYTAYGISKGVTLAEAPNGSIFYTFGTMKLINKYLHQEGA